MAMLADTIWQTVVLEHFPLAALLGIMNAG